MARVTAVSLRNAAREAMLAAGARGFVRFMDSGALLVSDAVRRCADEAAKHVAVVKNMADGEQIELPEAELFEYLRQATAEQR